MGSIARSLWWQFRRFTVSATRPWKKSRFPTAHGVLAETEPKVSVIIPTYNRAALVTRAAHSVLKQTYRNIELVIIDDGSTDNTLEFLVGIDDPRLKIVRGAHAGVSAARTLGMVQAGGDLIAFLDSDDEFMPRKVEAVVAALKANPGAVMAHSYWSEKSEGRQEILRPYADGDVRHDLLMFAPFSITTVVFRKSVLNVIKEMFDDGLAVCEDYDFLFRLAQTGSCVLVKEPLTLVHIHDGNTPRDPSVIDAARRHVIGKAFGGGSHGLASRGVYDFNSHMLKRMGR